MCSTPITIKNPYYGTGSYGVNFLHDTTSTHIQVPCGSCPECIALRQCFILQRVQMESLRSHLFMFTLTYNDESLVSVDVGDYSYPIPFYRDIQLMFKRFRNAGYEFEYMVSSEYGKKRFRPHYHGLFAVSKSLGSPRVLEDKYKNLFFSEWRRNYSQVKRCPEYRKLFTPVYELGRCTTFDFHYVEPVLNHDNDCAYYVSKYVTKYDKRTASLIQKIKLDPNLSHDEIDYLVTMTRPRGCMSKHLGDWKDSAIRSCINSYASRASDYKYPQYYDIYSGVQMPMSPYYGKRVVGFEHAYNRFEKLSADKDNNSFVVLSDFSPMDMIHSCDSSITRSREFARQMKILFDRCEF